MVCIIIARKHHVTNVTNTSNTKKKKVNAMKIVKKNVGNLDSLLRVIFGMIILFAGLWLNSLWGFVGLIFIASGALSYDPIYRILGKQSGAPNLEREN